MFISNYFWWDNDSDSCSDTSNYEIKLVENNLENINLKPIKRSSSYDSFFNEDKNDKQDKLDNKRNFYNLFSKIDNLDKKISGYSNKIDIYYKNNYKLVIGFGGSILFSFILLKFINK